MELSIMGNIRQNNIKNITSRLLTKHGNVFTSNFDDNKNLVAKYTTIESKVIRNRVAGYVTRKINHKGYE
jgi:small subunit ribosomal protein S17e